MKKATLIVNTTSETILAFVLLGIIMTSFIYTNNLSSINIKPEKQENVLGTFTYTNTFNPLYFSDDFITVKDAELNSGGASLNVNINSRKSQETIKIMNIYNMSDTKMTLKVILDFIKIDGNANYSILVNDKEQLVKDSFKPEQNNIPIEIETKKEAVISVKVASMERINTEFNVIFTENEN